LNTAQLYFIGSLLLIIKHM